MIYESCPALGNNKFIRSLQGFFRSVWYQALVVALMVCANVFSLELPVFYLYLLFGLTALLFAEDTLPLVPLFCCAYMTISPENNPATHYGESAFYDPAFRTQFIVILAVAAAAVAVRTVHLLCFSSARGERRGFPKLSFGFLALGIAYVLGGLFSPFYAGRTAFFGLVEIASLCALYFFFFYTVDFRRTEKEYLLSLFLLIGFGVILEMVRVYFLPGVIGPDGVDRGDLTTGWGMYNNIGCIIAMCIPASFYFASVKAKGWRFTLLGCVTLGGVVLTQSRTAILFGGLVFAACLVLVSVRSGGMERLGHLLVAGALILIAMALVVVFFPKVMELFASMIRFDTNGRDEIWRVGLKQFSDHPLFGVGFYECEAYRWGELPGDAFLPPRYHNTVLQLLASCGLVGLGCYIYHRVQTVRLLLARRSRENIFLALIIGVMLLLSFLDCHLFNFGPGILYSVILAFMERGVPAEQKENAEGAAV